MLVPALFISLNKAAAAPRWVSWPEGAGDGAWIGGGGGGAGPEGGGGTDPALAFATAPYFKKYWMNRQYLALEVNKNIPK